MAATAEPESVNLLRSQGIDFQPGGIDSRAPETFTNLGSWWEGGTRQLAWEASPYLPHVTPQLLMAYASPYLPHATSQILIAHVFLAHEL